MAFVLRPSSTPRREDGRDRALARTRRSNFPLGPSPTPVNSTRRRREFLGRSRAVCVPDSPASHDGVSDGRDKVVDSKSGAARQLRDEYCTRRGVDLDTWPVSVQKLGGCSKACADSTSCRCPGRSSYLRLTIFGMPARVPAYRLSFCAETESPSYSHAALCTPSRWTLSNFLFFTD